VPVRGFKASSPSSKGGISVRNIGTDTCRKSFLNYTHFRTFFITSHSVPNKFQLERQMTHNNILTIMKNLITQGGLRGGHIYDFACSYT